MLKAPAHVSISWAFFILIGMVFGYSYFFYPNDHPIGCLIKEYTGHDCPSCGFSRAFSYFTRLRFEEGLLYNSRAFPAFLFLLFQFLLRGFVILHYIRTKKSLSMTFIKCDIIISISGFLFAFLPLLIIR